MRRSWFYCLMLLISAEVAFAQARPSGFDNFSWGGGRSISTQPVPDSPHQDPSRDRPNRPHSGDHGGHNHDGHDHGDHHHGYRHRRPHWNNGWGWNNGIGWNWYLPPVFVTPGFNQFGYTYTLPYSDPVDSGVQPRDWLTPAPDPVGAGPAPLADPVPAGRISSPDQKAKAGRYVSYGDGQFAKQKYLAALGRYKSAADAAGDMAEAHLRQGFAYVAMGQFDGASKAFRRALTVRSNWQGAAFHLSALYDGSEATKTQHIEKLALAVEGNPFDSGLLMTLGIVLYFDGQVDRAELCFQSAARLGGSDELLVADFLQGADPVGVPVPGKHRKVSF